MPKMTELIKAEYSRLLKLEGDKLLEYNNTVNNLAVEVSALLTSFFKSNNIDEKDQVIIVENIKDNIFVEAIFAANHNFSEIEMFALASKRQMLMILKIMLEPNLKYQAAKILEYINITPSSIEDQNEILRWYRMLVEYVSKDYDNENEQLPAGGRKRKSSSK